MAVKPRPKTKHVKRYAGERGYKFFPLKSLFVVLCVAFAYFVHLHWDEFLEKLDDEPISAFGLIGQPKYTTFDDIRSSLTQFGELKGYFSQDVGKIKQQIELMPWIRGALVRKIWPNKLSIAVAEYMPVAYWNDNQLLAADGAIFSLPLEKRQDLVLPILRGNDFQSRDVLSAWHKISQALQAKSMTLQSLTIDDRGAWLVTLDSGVTLKLGRGEWKQKIDHLATIFPQIEVPENQVIDYIDLRYASGAAVSFRPISAPEQLTE